jgi:hypothetical protein
LATNLSFIESTTRDEIGLETVKILKAITALIPYGLAICCIRQLGMEQPTPSFIDVRWTYLGLSDQRILDHSTLSASSCIRATQKTGLNFKYFPSKHLVFGPALKLSGKK